MARSHRSINRTNIRTHQDGITYVPQTGRPLQTQGITLPTPENQATAFVSTISAGVGTAAANAAAQQVANAEQARNALTNEWSEMEYSAPITCTGANACAASGGVCKLGSKFGQLGENGILELTAEVLCSRVMAGIKIRLCFQVEWEKSGYSLNVKGTKV